MADEPPIAVLLLPRTLERFILRDQADGPPARAGGRRARAGAVPYGVLGRLPALLGDMLAAGRRAA